MDQQEFLSSKKIQISSKEPNKVLTQQVVAIMAIKEVYWQEM